MANPFIEKAKVQQLESELNPFVKMEKEKQAAKRQRQHKIARDNYEFLRGLLSRYTDNDDPEARERIRRRTQQAKDALDDYS